MKVAMELKEEGVDGNEDQAEPLTNCRDDEDSMKLLIGRSGRDRDDGEDSREPLANRGRS